MDYRPTIDETLMDVAFVMSRRGTCSRRQVGAVIADSRGVILSSGWNGALPGMPHCDDHLDHHHCTRSSHSERNAIFWAARRGVPIEGATLHCTDSPCIDCAHAIVQSGIVRLVYAREYRDMSGLELLREAGVQVDQDQKRLRHG